MLISYDPRADALRLEIGVGPPASSRELDESTELDFDEDGNLIGLQMLDVTERLGKEALTQLTVEGLATLVRPGEPMENYKVLYRDIGEIVEDIESSAK